MDNTTFISILIIKYGLNKIFLTRMLPVGITSPFLLLIASRKILESDAEPSHPGSTYINFISHPQTPKTLVAISHFRVRYLGLSTSGTFNLTCVPSNAPKQPYIDQ